MHLLINVPESSSAAGTAEEEAVRKNKTSIKIKI
jgi:hypothetical protein